MSRTDAAARTHSWEAAVASACARSMEAAMPGGSAQQEQREVTERKGLFDGDTGLPTAHESRYAVADIAAITRESARVRSCIGQCPASVRRLVVLLRWLADNLRWMSASPDFKKSRKARNVELTETVRVIRNVAAAGSGSGGAIAATLIESGVLTVLLDLAMEDEEDDSDDPQKEGVVNAVSALALQALANLCIGSSSARTLLWQIAFPDRLLAIVRKRRCEPQASSESVRRGHGETPAPSTWRWVAPLNTIVFSVVENDKQEAMRFALSGAGCEIMSRSIAELEDGRQGVSALDWVQRVLMRCAVHHGLMGRMFSFIGCEERMAGLAGSEGDDKNLLAPRTSGATSCSSSAPTEAFTSMALSGTRPQKLSAMQGMDQRPAKAKLSNGSAPGGARSVVSRLRDARETGDKIHMSGRYTLSQLRVLEMIFEGLQEASTREHSKLMSMGNSVSVRELESIQEANRAELSVWSAVPGAADVAFEAAERIANAAATPGSAGSADGDSTEGVNNTEILELALRIVRELSGMGEGEDNHDSGGGDSPHVHVIQQLIYMLCALPSIYGAMSEERRRHPASAERRTNGASPKAGMDDRVEGYQHRYPMINPYVGYRSDIIGAIGNMVYRRRQLQDAVRETDAIDTYEGTNGLGVVLSHCAPDESRTPACAPSDGNGTPIASSEPGGRAAQAKVNNPFLREWALFCVRNLTEGNLENQDAIKRLEVLEAAENQTMKDLGLEVKLNEKTKRPEVVVGPGHEMSTAGGASRAHAKNPSPKITITESSLE